ncbi:hypothetical protein C8F01DRAFT_966436, partial [Mycena amicta]
IYIEGAAGKSGSVAGAGLYFGPLSYSNASLPVPGPGKMTADRARVYAIFKALQRVNPDTTTVIYCTSKLIIRQLCYSAADNSAIGWPGQNGDIYKATTQALAKRHAQTFFVFVPPKSKNLARQQALSLATQ